MDYADLLEGITDQEEVVATRFGCDMPPEDIETVVDVGTGDGLWSFIMEDYAPQAAIYRFDWRPQALREGVIPYYPASADFVYCPKDILISMWGDSVTTTRRVPSRDICEMLEDLDAIPDTTVLRLSGLPWDTCLSQVIDLPPLMALVIQTVAPKAEEESDRLCEALEGLYDTENKSKGVIINVYAKFRGPDRILNVGKDILEGRFDPDAPYHII